MKKKTKTYYSDLIANVKTYITLNPDEQLSLKTLARSFAISSSHLSRIFNKETSDILTHFILTTRLDKVLGDLVHTSTSIADIAFSNGFNDYETFSRSFKRQFRVSPDDLRNILKQIILDNELPEQRMIIIKKPERGHHLPGNECQSINGDNKLKKSNSL